MSLRGVGKRIGWRRHLRRGRIWLDSVPDRILGIETAGWLSHSALGFGPERGIHYEASPWRILSKTLPPNALAYTRNRKPKTVPRRTSKNDLLAEKNSYRQSLLTMR